MGIAHDRVRPGATAQAHQREESIEIAALLRSFQVLEAFGT